MIIGSTVRIATQNTTERGLIRSVKEMLYEMRAIGYDRQFLKKAMNKVKRKPDWRVRAHRLVKYIDEQL